jgi:hypothetical protein
MVIADCWGCEIPIFLKDNLGYPKKIQEYPTEQYKIIDKQWDDENKR